MVSSRCFDITACNSQVAFMLHEKTSDAQGAIFQVPAKRKGQKSILFGRIESKLVTRESSEDNPKSPQFSYYRPNACHMMKNFGNDLMKGPAWTLAIEDEHCSDPLSQKGKPLTASSNSEGIRLYVNFNPIGLWVWEIVISHHSSDTSSWESDVSVDNIFEGLSVNMVSTSPLKDEDEDEGMI